MTFDKNAFSICFAFRSCSIMVILNFLLILSLVETLQALDPLVFTKYGPVLGLTQFSRNSREYLSFRGIPYARPPLGHLRFQAPEPPEPWSFPLNATADAPFCMQKDYFYSSNPKVEGSEDCLYLNIYVPKTDFTQPLPVMVYVHGGGLIAGRADSTTIGPEYLMDRNIILVSFNYRVGFFGFFTTLDDAAPGNTGLKDQVMALEFVQDNINYFGGDKNRVTIFGQSAGGSCVNLLMISPLSRGLFHQAISQSGVALDIFAKPLNYVQSLFTPILALFTNCGDYVNNNWDLVKCLRQVDAANLTEAVQKFKYFSVEPIAPHSIVIEKRTGLNPRPFLTKDPLQYLQSGTFMKVPWLVGVTQDEGIFRVAQLTRQPKVLHELNSDMVVLLPLMLGLPLSNGDTTEALFKNIVKFYFGGKYFIDVNNPKSVQCFIDLYSDRTINYGTYQNVILQSKKGHRPIWMYNFNYRGQHSYGDQFASTTKDINFKWGVSHSDDLLYLFRTPARFPDLTSITDLQMSEDMVTFWTNFAIFGDPDPLQVVGWKSLSFSGASDVRNENLNVLHIEGSHLNNSIGFRNVRGFFPERMRFWTKQKLLENFPGLE